MPHTSLATIGQIAWRLLEMHRIDAAPLFAEQGLGREMLQDPNARILVAKWDALMQRAVQLDPAPGFALVAAKCWHPSNLGPLGYAWLSSTTLRSGLQRVMRYWKLIGERSSLRLEESAGRTRIVLTTNCPDEVISGLVADFTLSVLFSMCRMNRGDDLQAVELGMRYVWPGEQEAYERHFACPVVCGAAEDWLTLHTADLDAPLPTANKEVAATLDRILAEQLAHLDRTNVVARCKASLLEQLSEGELSEADMAPAPGGRHAARPGARLHRGPAPLDHRHHLYAGLLAAERVHARVQALDRRRAERVPPARAQGCGRGRQALSRGLARADQPMAHAVKPRAAHSAHTVHRAAEGPMGYRLTCNSTGEPCDTVEMHVLARAYRAAWRAAHACEPAHRLLLRGLDLVIEFDGAWVEDASRTRIAIPQPPARG
jgi:hypothetical protein